MWNIYVKFKNTNTEFFRLYTTVVQKKKKKNHKTIDQENMHQY